MYNSQPCFLMAQQWWKCVICIIYIYIHICVCIVGTGRCPCAVLSTRTRRVDAYIHLQVSIQSKRFRICAYGPDRRTSPLLFRVWQHSSGLTTQRALRGLRFSRSSPFCWHPSLSRSSSDSSSSGPCQVSQKLWMASCSWRHVRCLPTGS